jgi:hypothetical protein
MTSLPTRTCWYAGAKKPRADLSVLALPAAKAIPVDDAANMRYSPAAKSCSRDLGARGSARIGREARPSWARPVGLDAPAAPPIMALNMSMRPSEYRPLAWQASAPSSTGRAWTSPRSAVCSDRLRGTMASAGDARRPFFGLDYRRLGSASDDFHTVEIAHVAYADGAFRVSVDSDFPVAALILGPWGGRPEGSRSGRRSPRPWNR